MSNMTLIRTALHDELSTEVEIACVRERVRSEIGLSIVAIVVSVLLMAGLIAFRLWWLMPASVHFQI